VLLMTHDSLNRAYDHARERYAEHGVDADAALAGLAKVAISLHCWQGDDVGGFEQFGMELGGGLAATGNYPGKARTPEELRADAEKAFALIPGRHRFNLHAFYGDFGGKRVDRDAIDAGHFAQWIDWARRLQIGLDFNPTYFSHPLAADNITLSHADPGVREFWIAHGLACRRIGGAIGKALETTCVTNFWIPDGMKDTPIDRVGPRERLLASLDAIFDESIDHAYNRDAVEGKLFGIGCESFTVGSHEFYFTSAVVSAGTATTSFFSTTIWRRSRRSSCAATSSTACTSGSTISTPASTVSPPGRSARATCSRRC
jgi:L-rhamnose isomerase